MRPRSIRRILLEQLCSCIEALVERSLELNWYSLIVCWQPFQLSVLLERGASTIGWCWSHECCAAVTQVSAGDEGPAEERAAQRGSDRTLAKARAQRKRRELQQEVRSN